MIDLAGGLKLVAHRTRLMMQLCDRDSTSMLAISCDTDYLAAVIESDRKFQGLAIACNNSPSDCVVGGQISQLKELKQHLKSKLKVQCKMLEVPMAFHTEAVDPILAPLLELARTIDILPPKIPVVSNVLGRVVACGEGAFTPQYFPLHCRQTVKFEEGVREFIQKEEAPSRWIEIGPHPSLIPMIRSNLDSRSADLLVSLRKGVPPSTTISQLLCSLYLTTTGLDWRRTFDGTPKPSLVDLPGMPFSLTEFLVRYPREACKNGAKTASTENPSPEFIHTLIQQPSLANGFTAIFEAALSDYKDFITGHLVCDYALCPASVYHQIALSASARIRSNNDGDFTYSVSQVSYKSPLLYVEGFQATLRVTLKPGHESGALYSFVISSHNNGSEMKLETIHCQGLIKIRRKSDVDRKNAKLVPQLLEKQVSWIREPSSQEIFLAKTMYEKVFTRVVTYSKLFQAVKTININAEINEAFATCQLPDANHTDSPASGIVMMDVLLHIAGFAANLNADNQDICICKEVKSASIVRNIQSMDKHFHVHCSIFPIVKENAVLAEAYAWDLNGIIAVSKGMLFQKVKLAKLSHSFQLVTEKISGKMDQHIRKATVESSESALLAPKGSNILLLNGRTPKELPAIRAIIANTCGTTAARLSGDSTLEALGFDSLMMIELVSNLTSECGGHRFDISALNGCTTISDVEELLVLRSHEDSTDAIPAPVLRNSLEERPLVASVIAETCGARVGSITSKSELHTLGVDSLMILELHSRLQSICNSKELSSSELSTCRTVGDVEKLVGCARPWTTYGR